MVKGYKESDDFLSRKRKKKKSKKKKSNAEKFLSNKSLKKGTKFFKGGVL